MNHPRVRKISVDASEGGQPTLEVLPIYRLTSGINQRQMRKFVQLALDEGIPLMREALPESIRRDNELMGIADALRQIHFPESLEQRDAARRRFVFQEFLVLRLALAMRRHSVQTGGRAVPLPCDARIDARIRRLIPFELTEGQERVIQEVAADVDRQVPMNRLLQGDVGSGKSIIAVYAMLLAVAAGKQAILMAPTEVLAKQHYDRLREMLESGRVRLALVTGSITGKEREELFEAARTGQIDILIGTQAIVQSRVSLPRMALIIIDEQHRFGVKMRAQLRDSGVDPHYLVMTATPIPRTVAMIEFGDLDVSELRQLPPNRPDTHTYWVTEAKRDSFWQFFREQLDSGRQGMVITPLVDERESSEMTSAESTFESLVNGPLEAYRCDLVHGKLPSEAKLFAMERFQKGETQVLVATSIVEVGIDVPNLTVMVIENAERFGLAALHQLRGRVGRGSHDGYVGVFAKPTTEEGKQRIEAFVATNDGFALAEKDFELRGPGDLFGTRQHGLPPLRIADLRADEAIYSAAGQLADTIIKNDPLLELPEHSELRRQATARYGSALSLSDVG